MVCNKRVIESLIKAGAFESMGHSRRALMSVYESAVDGVLDLKRNEAHGQDDLFGDLGETDPVLVGSVPGPARLGQAHQARVRARDARSLRQ